MYVHVLPNPPPGTRLAAIREFLDDRGEPAYRFGQLLKAVSAGRRSFDRMSDLPRGLRTALVEAFGPTITTLRTIATHHEPQVEKVLFESSTGARIESVLSHYRDGWTSLCLSTQVGCGLGCTFCATGAVGLVRNLTTDEICAQVLHFPRVDSIAFMGMGEALANPHTFTALRLLTDPGFLRISSRRITVSTVGFLPGLRRLVDEQPGITITLSVHSPFAEERGRLIPLHHRFPLADNLEVLDRHVATTGRRVYLAYLLIDGVNDDADHVEELVRLVRARSRPHLFRVNVIAYNPAAGARPEYSAPAPERVHRFVGQLNRRGIRATRRQQFGTGIDAACGQLHARYLTTDPSLGLSTGDTVEGAAHRARPDHSRRKDDRPHHEHRDRDATQP